METTFKSLTTKENINLVEYIQKYLQEYPNTDIYIGCDSQNFKRNTSYATVIVLHDLGKGGHVLYSKESIPRIHDKFTRLWREVEKSIETAEYLKENNIKKPSFIDLDLNPDVKYQSNKILQAALGYVEAMGYKARCKPDAMSASHVADALCK